MSEHVVPTIRVQRADFDAGAEVARLTSGRAGIGAVVTFTGLCRDEAGSLAALELEHYPGMAERQIARIADRALARWPIGGVTVIHRFGRIGPGENIVLVVTTSAHRQVAFDAASYLMDFLKTSAPFWKKELRRGAAESDWVQAKDEDDDLADRWR